MEDIIKELTEVRPEMLNEKALKLYDFIMKMLDENEILKSLIDLFAEERLKGTNPYLFNVFNKDQVIDCYIRRINNEKDWNIGKELK